MESINTNYQQPDAYRQKESSAGKKLKVATINGVAGALVSTGMDCFHYRSALKEAPWGSIGKNALFHAGVWGGISLLLDSMFSIFMKNDR